MSRDGKPGEHESDDMGGGGGCVRDHRGHRQDSITHQAWKLGETRGLPNLQGCVLGSGLDGISNAKVQKVEEKQVQEEVGVSMTNLFLDGLNLRHLRYPRGN